MSYELALFDLDGTVLDTIDDLADAVNHVLANYNMPPRTADEVCAFTGNGAYRLIELSVPKNTPSEITEKVFNDYRAYYAAHSEIKTAPYKGICEMLKKLRAAGCKTAVLSNKPDAPVVTLCAKYFPGLFDCAAGEKEGIKRKPAPDGILPILEKLGVSADKTVYIGDSEVDVETAKNAGLDCISVDWGFRSRDELIKAGAVRIVSTADELYDAIIK